MKTLELNQMESVKGGDMESAFGCAAGLLVVIGSVASGFNPLGVIAGAGLAHRFC